MSGTAQPRQIGRYQVVDVLGAGSMGVVYKAHDPAIGRDVAIKLVRIDANGTHEHTAAVDRLRIEARAAGRCHHPAIVSVFDFVEQDGVPAIVMEFVEGRSLYGHLRDRAARAALDPLRLVRQVLEALAYAHGQSVIHRDIKPANLLMTVAGSVKIADFGIARLPGLNATLSGGTLGTPNYMAPEQLGGTPADQRADLFAVGAVLYELLAGRPPFAAETTAATLVRVAGPEPADVTPLPLALQPVLARALAKDRAQRFFSAADFIAALPSGPQAAVVDEATILLPANAAAQASLSQARDPTLLRLAERELAHFLGPMARLLVTRAVDDAATPDALVAALAEHLPNPADRSRFLRAVASARGDASLSHASRPGSLGGGSRSGAPTGGHSLGTQTRPGGTGSTTVRPFAGVPDEAVASAQVALVQHVGPIARLLVREAAAQAVSARDFVERLCAHVQKPDAQAALRRRLAAEVEPKLG